MKKYLNYILIASVLVIIALVLFLKDKPGTLKVDTDAFAVKDTASITSIKINDGKNMVVLEKVGSNWQVNRQFSAKPKSIRALLGLLTSLEINSPVAKGMKASVIRSFKSKAVTVLIESEDKILKAYQITEDDSLKIGSFMLLKDDKEPYLVRVPGFDGRISKLFPCDVQFWRDKAIFKYKPADILSIEVVYPARPKASFVYLFNDFNNLEIKSLNGNKIVKINKEMARAYLLNFSSVSYETQVKWHAKEIFDSLKHEKPYCQITVKNALNQPNLLKTYRINVQSKKGEFDLNRMYAVHQNDTVPLLVKYVDFDLIMKEFSDFSSR